ncbi:hypothetical protein B0A69_08500 [Chryseobacterium shigense]|uniref:DoxX protein n=1 Tax=Chryseobacterium shigense TaxID=297244 RepID=A0A1N7IFQ7_9FLAO|nr:hypothetical protein [Chryseobacterium shigense]PQA94496.1 hypothetical protein B0A69_08500 [Chryseobacterium shigense]SIS35856.1 hypothetical protein SAMN05421639_103487 [Chryseobacterium shigense]
MRSSFLLCAGIFFLLFMFFFPLEFLGEFQYKTSLFLWGDFTAWITENLFKTKHSRTDFSSDSISMVVLSIILLLISIIAALIIKQKYHKKILYYSREITILYLAVVLMKYGFDKIFKAQFYLPEPNILYSRFGNLDKDILFWSTMGTSRLYSVSAGILELLAALLILFHKTRTAGLLVSIGILINIFLINIGFDISVKLFSLILFFMAVFALKDDWKPVFRFLILKKEPKFEDRREAESKFHPVWIFFKTAFVGLSMAVILFPLMNSGNFNDDKADRPFLHGAFKNLDTDSDIQYIFFHRNSYIILMDKSEKMVDFHYTQSSKNQLILEDYANKKTEVDYVYQKKDSLLTLNFGKYMVRTKELNWRKMNALKPLFHVTIEDME